MNKNNDKIFIKDEQDMESLLTKLKQEMEGGFISLFN